MLNTTSDINTFMAEAKPRKPGVISKVVTTILMDKLPRKLKRLIFLASVLAVVEDIKNPTNEILRKLNALFKLAHDESAIMLPMYIHTFIWRNTSMAAVLGDVEKQTAFKTLIETHIAKGDYTSICEAFYKSTPLWLIYGSHQLLTSDLNKLFENMQEIVAE